MAWTKDALEFFGRWSEPQIDAMKVDAGFSKYNKLRRVVALERLKSMTLPGFWPRQFSHGTRGGLLDTSKVFFGWVRFRVLHTKLRPRSEMLKISVVREPYSTALVCPTCVLVVLFNAECQCTVTNLWCRMVSKRKNGIRAFRMSSILYGGHWQLDRLPSPAHGTSAPNNSPACGSELFCLRWWCRFHPRWWGGGSRTEGR